MELEYLKGSKILQFLTFFIFVITAVNNSRNPSSECFEISLVAYLIDPLVQFLHLGPGLCTSEIGPVVSFVLAVLDYGLYIVMISVVVALATTTRLWRRVRRNVYAVWDQEGREFEVDMAWGDERRDLEMGVGYEEAREAQQRI